MLDTECAGLADRALHDATVSMQRAGEWLPRIIYIAAMIFAAGLGTRMGALTADRPKPLIPVAGLPLLDHALAIARPAAQRIVVNTHYRADQIAAHLAGTDTLISHEPGPLLETGGGLKAALPLLGPLQQRRGVARGPDLVAQARERLAQDQPDRAVIIGDEDLL
jgi:bifunctional N-acetylglucosamine-1-phosphate-uridyltransferase/glucosamine-1-phosphate-acetyltransferase GlmU-like protein